MLVERGEAVVGGQRGWQRGQPKGGNMDESKYLLQQQMHIVGLLIVFQKHLVVLDFCCKVTI